MLLFICPPIELPGRSLAGAWDCMTGLSVLSDVGLLLGLRLRACHSLGQFHSQDARNPLDKGEITVWGTLWRNILSLVTHNYLTRRNIYHIYCWCGF